MTVALVTGANRGIGREVAIQLSALGHRVLIGSRDAGKAADAAAAVDAADGRATVVQLDLASPASIARIGAELESIGQVDPVQRARRLSWACPCSRGLIRSRRPGGSVMRRLPRRAPRPGAARSQ